MTPFSSDGSLPDITFLKPVAGSGLEEMGYFANAQIKGDINHDDVVDAEDLILLTDQWLKHPSIPSADIAPPGGDGEVNMLDFALLAKHWAPDTIPPAPPTGLSATGDFGTISLDWDDNNEPDLNHYVVYRSTTSGSDFSAIDTNVAASNYVDDTVSDGTTYYYIVTAVDNKANESNHSVEESAALRRLREGKREKGF